MKYLRSGAKHDVIGTEDRHFKPRKMTVVSSSNMVKVSFESVLMSFFNVSNAAKEFSYFKSTICSTNPLAMQ